MDVDVHGFFAKIFALMRDFDPLIHILSESAFQEKFNFDFEDLSVDLLPSQQFFRLGDMDFVLESIVLSPLSLEVRFSTNINPSLRRSSIVFWTG